MQQERDELYRKFTAAIQEVQQKTGFKNLVLERKLQALNAAVEKREVQFNEVLAASNLDPAALTLVSRKLEVGADGFLKHAWCLFLWWALQSCSLPYWVAQRLLSYVRGCHGFYIGNRACAAGLWALELSSCSFAPYLLPLFF